MNWVEYIYICPKYNNTVPSSYNLFGMSLAAKVLKKITDLEKSYFTGGWGQGTARDVTFRLRYEGNEKSLLPRKCVSRILR